MMLKHGFNGIEINWKFMENEAQKTRFVTLIKPLREKLTKTGENTH